MNNTAQSPESTEESFTDWKNPPKLTDLKQDLEDAKLVHDDHKTKVTVWLDNLNVTGKAVVDTGDGNSKIVPKLIRKQAEWRYASLSEPFLSTDDVFNVRPVTWEDRDAAQQNELLLNNQFNGDIDKVAFIDEYVRTAVDEGTVIVRVGWEFHEELQKVNKPIVTFQPNPEMGPMFEQLIQMQQESPSQFATDVPDELKQALQITQEQGIPMEPVVTGYEEVEEMKTVYNRPTAEVCDYRNVILDPTCYGDLSKANFVVYRFETSLSQLEKEGKRYKNLDKIQISNNSILSEPDHPRSVSVGNFNFKDEPRKKFLVHEYWGFWDIDGSGIAQPIVASWAGNTMIRMEANPFPDKALPFVMAHYLPVRKSNYGEPDGVLLEDNQKIIGAVTRGMIDVMGKSANGQTGIRKDMLDVTNRRKFEKGLDYEFNANIDPRQGVHMHVFPEIPNSAQFMLQLQNMEAESMTGVKSFSQGVSGASLGDVAAGIRGALDAASKRELGILRRLSSGIEKIGRKFISMNSEFLSDEEVVRVTNDQFVKVRRDDLAGKFDLKLSISTAEEDNNKAQELAFMMQTNGANMDPALGRMIQADIARLRKMPDLAKKIEDYQPEPDPIAQRMGELQVALLEAQIATEQSKAMLNQANAQLGGAKVGTEAAKQGHLQSDTDQKNLDFVEQESGVKQERALEQTGEQARSQAQLKVMDQQLQREGHDVDLLKEYMKQKNK
jgi:hypothetical protein